jgi:hypothetical protein
LNIVEKQGNATTFGHPDSTPRITGKSKEERNKFRRKRQGRDPGERENHSKNLNQKKSLVKHVSLNFFRNLKYDYTDLLSFMSPITFK